MSQDILPSSSPSSSWTLAIPAVLKSVLENLYNQDLFRCRLVCQSWAKEAGRIIGKRLDKVSSLDQLEDLQKIQTCSDISIPLKKLRLGIPASFNIDQSSIQSYNTVTSLVLGCCPSLVPHILVNTFPNLESLCLSRRSEFRDNVLVAPSAVVWENGTLSRLRYLYLCFKLEDSQSVWMSLVNKLLEKAVKLESIDVSQVEASTAATLIAKVCSTSLKSITASQEDFSDTSKLFFTALNNHPIIFPLETIDLAAIDIDTVSKPDIKLLLSRFSSTLTQLLLGFNGIFEMNFPLGVPMKKLHTLIIQNLRGSMEWKNLPQLKILILVSCSIEGIAASISSTPAYCHLEALHIHTSKDEGDKFLVFFREIAENLGPQLKTLGLYYVSSDSLLPVVFTYLTQLNRLTLEGIGNFSDISDKDLCGTDSLSFRPPSKRNIGASLKKAYQRRIASAKKSNHVRGANITNLKDLHCLSITGSFTEVAVLHGIVQCEKLRELSLTFPNDGTARDSTVRLLANAGLENLTKVEVDGKRLNHLSFAPKAPRER